jgi:hypothetical protein
MEFLREWVVNGTEPNSTLDFGGLNVLRGYWQRITLTEKLSVRKGQNIRVIQDRLLRQVR